MTRVDMFPQAESMQGKEDSEKLGLLYFERLLRRNRLTISPGA